MQRIVRKTTLLAFILVAASVWIPVASATLVFNLTPGPSMNPLALAGFQTAADRWASLLVDAVTVLLTIRIFVTREEFHQAALGMSMLTVALEAAVTPMTSWRPVDVT